jgi:hypothetical protein
MAKSKLSFKERMALPHGHCSSCGSPDGICQPCPPLDCIDVCKHCRFEDAKEKVEEEIKELLKAAKPKPREFVLPRPVEVVGENCTGVTVQVGDDGFSSYELVWLGIGFTSKDMKTASLWPEDALALAGHLQQAAIAVLARREEAEEVEET